MHIVARHLINVSLPQEERYQYYKSHLLARGLAVEADVDFILSETSSLRKHCYVTLHQTLDAGSPLTATLGKKLYFNADSFNL